MSDRRTRWWIAVGCALCTLLVVVVFVPVLRNPQLEADEFRYLFNIQAYETDPEFGFLDACMVVNNWDGLWWVQPRAEQRYFRPVVFTSFLLNGDLGAGYLKLAWMNLLLHSACCCLVLALLYRLVGVGLPALLGAVYFSVLSCHGEALWYFSGRNATLAALGLLGALVCHVNGRRRLALLPFLLALSAKESTVVLPALCLLFDMWCRGEPRTLRQALGADRTLYAAYLAIIVTWLAIRTAITGALPGGDPYPYLVLPFSGHFLSHLATQFVSYSQNLGLGLPTQPFMTTEHIFFFWYAFLPFLLIASAGCWFARHDRRLAWAIALGLLTWLPTCFVYISERYLYMPSIAWAAVFALLLARALPHPPRPIAALPALAALLLIAIQFNALLDKNTILSQPRMTTTISERLAQAIPTLPPDRTPVFLHFPGDWVQAQFLPHQLRIRHHRNDLEAHVLSGRSPTVARVEPEDDHTIVVRSETPFLGPSTSILPWVDLSPGARYTIPTQHPGEAQRTPPAVTVEILEGDGATARAIRYRFAKPLSQLLILRFRPPAAPSSFLPDPSSEAQWVAAGRFEVLRTR